MHIMLNNGKQLRCVQVMSFRPLNNCKVRANLKTILNVTQSTRKVEFIYSYAQEITKLTETFHFVTYPVTAIAFYYQYKEYK